MKYSITLHQKHEPLCPYHLDIDAYTEQEAIYKAKKILAEIAYWGHLDLCSIEERMNRLVLDKIFTN